jgi:hypothetical protein
VGAVPVRRVADVAGGRITRTTHHHAAVTIGDGGFLHWETIMSFDPPSGKAGAARMREIGNAKEAEVQKAKDRLIEGLGRPATGAEEAEAELIAATLIRARYLRRLGKDDGAERRLLQRFMKSTIYGSVPAPSTVEVQHGKAVGDAFAERDRAFRAASLERDQENHEWYRSVTTDAAGDPNAE